MDMITAWLLPIALMASAPEENRSDAFRVGLVSFTAAIPPGFCLPGEEDAAVSQLVAAGDTANVTHLTVNSCDKSRRWVDYYLVKTPTTILLATTTNEEFQRVMEPVLAEGFDSEAIGKSASERLSDMMQTKVDIKGKVSSFGKDETCVYLGGILDAKAPDRDTAYTLAMAACMTVIEGKVMTIYRYGAGDTVAAIEALRPAAKAFAKDIAVAATR